MPRKATEEKKSRAWLGIVYPESCKPDWQAVLAQNGCQALISPLHEHDLNADGEVKKPHYHVIMVWDGPTTYTNAMHYNTLIGGAGTVMPCATLRGAARYLVHMDNPEKYQYSREDVMSIGGLDYDAIINSASDELLALCEIIDFIEDNDIISFRELVLICKSAHMDWFRVIMTSQRENVWKYLRSKEYDSKLDTQREAVRVAQSQMLGAPTDLQSEAQKMEDDRKPFG